MKITKTNRVHVEITNRVNGMLEQGGVCGRVVSYPLEGVIKATGLTKDQIATADQSDLCPAYNGITIAEACDHEMNPTIVRVGHIIE